MNNEEEEEESFKQSILNEFSIQYLKSLSPRRDITTIGPESNNNLSRQQYQITAQASSSLSPNSHDRPAVSSDVNNLNIALEWLSQIVEEIESKKKPQEQPQSIELEWTQNEVIALRKLVGIMTRKKLILTQSLIDVFLPGWSVHQIQDRLDSVEFQAYMSKYFDNRSKRRQHEEKIIIKKKSRLEERKEARLKRTQSVETIPSEPNDIPMKCNEQKELEYDDLYNRLDEKSTTPSLPAFFSMDLIMKDIEHLQKKGDIFSNRVNNRRLPKLNTPLNQKVNRDVNLRSIAAHESPATPRRSPRLLKVPPSANKSGKKVKDEANQRRPIAETPISTGKKVVHKRRSPLPDDWGIFSGED